MLRLKRRIKNQGGFTLIELIIVIAIMGFLVAMIAPRLAGVMAGAERGVSDTSQARLQTILDRYAEENRALPNNLTNLIVQTGAAVFAPLSELVDDGRRETGQEIFSARFASGTGAQLHFLSGAEVDELRAMGITQVHNLNLSQAVTEYNGNVMNWNTAMPSATFEPFMTEVAVSAGVPVLMYAAGFDQLATTPAWSFTPAAVNQPDLAFRIILGVGPDSALVREGLINTAGLSPSALRRDALFAYSNYNIVLPRLRSTVDSIILNVPAWRDLTFTDGATNQERAIEFLPQQLQQLNTLSPEGDTLAGAGAGSWTRVP